MDVFALHPSRTRSSGEEVSLLRLDGLTVIVDEMVTDASGRPMGREIKVRAAEDKASVAA